MVVDTKVHSLRFGNGRRYNKLHHIPNCVQEVAQDPARNLQLVFLWFRPLSQTVATQPGRCTYPMKVRDYETIV